MMDKKFKIELTQLLAVEGKDECNFFMALLKKNGILNVQLVDIGGKDKFPIEFDLLNSLEGFNRLTSIGFVRDAEGNPAESALSSICHLLKKYGLPFPKALGEIAQDDKLRIGIYIMPDNAGTGMLENLCLKTIDNTSNYDCVDRFIKCFTQNMPGEERSVFNEPKARVQAYLASRAPIVNSLGIGGLKGFRNMDHECLVDIKNFLNKLYSGVIQ
jgi:hypothetical protein